MLRASGVDAVLDPDTIPALDGAPALLAQGITSSLHQDNLAALAALDEACPNPSAGSAADRPADRGRAARRPCRRSRRSLSARIAPSRLSRGTDRPYRALFRSRTAGAPRSRRGDSRARAGRRLVTASPRQGRAALPAVDKILRSAGGAALILRYGRSLVLDAVRAALAARREVGDAGSVEAIVADSAAILARLSRAVAASCLQPDRHRSAHQSRPRAVAGGSDRGGGGGDARPLEPRIRSRHRPARRARRPHFGLARPPDRSRGSPRRQQQRRRAGIGAEHPRRRA